MIRAYIDYQNAFRLLKDKTGFCLQSLKIGSLIAELLDSVGEVGAPPHRAFSGIHAEDVDPQSRNRRIRQFDALRHHEGISVFSRDYAYRRNVDGFLQSREKGIDVRMGCEIVAAAASGEVDGVLIWSADQDLSEAVKIARNIAAEHGRRFTLYGVETEGTTAVAGTVPIKLTRPLLYRHLRSDHDTAALAVADA